MLLLSPTSLCMLFEENLNNITRVSPVNAPGNAPDVSAPGIRVKPVVHAKILITIHQPAQSTSFLNRSHCSTPTLPPSTGPVNKVMVGIKITYTMYPTIHPSELKTAHRQALCMRLYRTAHCKTAMAAPDMITGIPPKRRFPSSQPKVVAMIQ